MTKEEAIEKMQKQKERYLEEWLDYSGVSKAYDMAIEALKRPDTMTAVLFDGMSGSKKIGLQPAKHGKWEIVKLNNYNAVACSECGEPSVAETPYCSYCGAKMDKE